MRDARSDFLYWGLCGLFALACTAAQAAAPRAASKATEGMVARGDLEVVECLLPGQVRQLGGTTFVAQRRPTRTTTADCRIRGGEYVSYDRADYKSALRIWMETAQAGDPEAQNNVGEIYERGLGDAPNYPAAIIWYQKAADQNYSRALFNLGTLYEQGFGVEQDRLQALNLYRRAWGVGEDNLIYASAARREQDQVRTELEKSLAEKDRQLQLLRKQLQQLEGEARRRAAQAGNPTPQTTQEIETMQSLLAKLEAERSGNAGRLANLPAQQTREPVAREPVQPLDAVVEPRLVKGIDFGRYFALIIGNQNYQILESLQTPRTDVERAAHLLREKYGFSVQIIEDANDVTMLRALNELNKVLRPTDNVLIYYAGHGTRLKTGAVEAGYWLPVNAERPPNDTFWVPNEQITAHLARLPARRVLVVADSCYAGLLSSDPGINIFGTENALGAEYVKFKLPKRARLLLASGGDQPVLDQGGQGNSVFARAFLDVLSANDGVLPTPTLFTRVQARVKIGAARSNFTQVPEFKAIKSAGHEMGDFFFVPRKTS
jgi:TPR repeat protein